MTMHRLFAAVWVVSVVGCGGGGSGGGAPPQPGSATVPNVVGLTQAPAITAIQGAGLSVGTITNASSATVPPGSVISENPVAGTSAAVNSAVNLVISSWVSGVFLPASDFEARCAVPRTGIDPGTGRAYPDVMGTAFTEKSWLRSWSNDLYLWYSEIVDQDPAPYTVANYFALLKTNASTTSGNPKDKFHFTYLTSDWEKLSQSGTSAGYGANWVIIAAKPPRNVLVAYTDPGTPATDPPANLVRGTQVLTVDGVDVVNDNTQAGVATLNAVFFPANANETHTFTVKDPGAAGTRSFAMTSEDVVSTPVQNVEKIPTASGTVGYIQFNDHIATAEQELIDAVNSLNANGGITDLVLDIRYNGGGYLVVASEVAYMIGGARAVGKTFETTNFNDKHPTFDPVTGQRITPLPFQTTAVGLSATSGQALPTLSLSRVFVLTGATTCSASESIINSLEGINVDVIQIGSTTCGKPYGFYPQDNCGTTYFTIEFQGDNAKGFGDYTDGFSPANTPNIPGVPNSGCSVADDYSKQLGDPLEGRLATALSYRQGNACPAATGVALPPGVEALSLPTPSDGIVVKPLWLQNKIMRR